MNGCTRFVLAHAASFDRFRAILNVRANVERQHDTKTPTTGSCCRSCFILPKPRPRRTAERVLAERCPDEELAPPGDEDLHGVEY